jgi:biotin carboxyl carrier protein
MKLKAELAGEHHEVTIQSHGETVSAVVDGRQYELKLRDSGNEYLLLQGTHVRNCRVENRRSQRETYVVHLGARSYEIQVTNPKRLRSQPSAGAHHDGAAEIIASMPGKVVRVMVDVDTHVEAGAGIVVVEAMKMQNEMKTPKAGIVAKLNAEVGATVNAGDVLAVIE